MESNHRGHEVAAINHVRTATCDGASTNKQPVLARNPSGKQKRGKRRTSHATYGLTPVVTRRAAAERPPSGTTFSATLAIVSRAAIGIVMWCLKVKGKIETHIRSAEILRWFVVLTTDLGGTNVVTIGLKNMNG